MMKGTKRILRGRNRNYKGNYRNHRRFGFALSLPRKFLRIMIGFLLFVLSCFLVSSWNKEFTIFIKGFAVLLLFIISLSILFLNFTD